MHFKITLLLIFFLQAEARAQNAPRDSVVLTLSFSPGTAIAVLLADTLTLRSTAQLDRFISDHKNMALSDKAIIIATSDTQIDFFLPYYTFLKKKRYRIILQTPPRKRPDEHRVI